MSIIISNTTPINYSVLIDQIDVLYHLYGRVVIPPAVLGAWRLNLRTGILERAFLRRDSCTEGRIV